MDIDPDLLDYTTPFKESLVNDAKRYYDYRNRLLKRRESTQAFVLNSRVVHPVFGIGTVTGIDPDSKSYEILFDSMKTPRNLSFNAKLAPADKQQQSQDGATASSAG